MIWAMIELLLVPGTTLVMIRHAFAASAVKAGSGCSARSVWRQPSSSASVSFLKGDPFGQILASLPQKSPSGYSRSSPWASVRKESSLLVSERFADPSSIWRKESATS